MQQCNLMQQVLPYLLSHATYCVAAMKASVKEETCVKLVQTVRSFIYLCDYTHYYHVNNNKGAACQEVSKELLVSIEWEDWLGHRASLGVLEKIKIPHACWESNHNPFS
jgi:hypothetical protein